MLLVTRQPHAQSAIEAAVREMQAGLAAAMQRARTEAAAVRISGATGAYAWIVNGLFELTEEEEEKLIDAVLRYYGKEETLNDGLAA